MSELDANIIVNGQKAVATVAQTGTVIQDGGAIDATSVIQTASGPQKVVKTYDLNGGGGGGGGTSDYSDLSNKPQINSVTLTGNKTGAGANFNLSQVESMPTIDRSVYDVVKFTPQAAVNKNGGLSFAGTNNRYNSFQIDGAIANDAFGLSSSGTNGGQTGANPISMDAIEEIQVVVAPFDVRQSGFTGGAINSITKSGTNKVQGSAYAYYNNQDFVGTTAGPIKEGAERQKYTTQSNQTYGFTIGAPIIKNKLFIFASAEYFRNSYPNIYSPDNGSYDDITLNSPVTVGGKTYEKFNSELAGLMIVRSWVLCGYPMLYLN